MRLFVSTRLLLGIVLTLGGILLLVIGVLYVFSFSRDVFTHIKNVEPAEVAIVFGEGIVGDRPSDVLSDRLEVAAKLYDAGLVKRLLVSGDNSTPNYSEPDVMFSTLVGTYEIPASDVYVDYAGRRTYDTCIRARQLWGVERAILVSQEYHLPRAIWTCEKLGIESVGVSASLQPYRHEDRYKQRELLAIIKAFLDVYFLRPDYIGGEFIEDLEG